MADLRLIEGGREPGIATLPTSAWPTNRERGDFRQAMREAAGRELRVTICGHCGVKSPALDGPTARLWWRHHIERVCEGSAA